MVYSQRVPIRPTQRLRDLIGVAAIIFNTRAARH